MARKTKIIPVNQPGDRRQGRLVGLDFADIERVLGFKANVADDPSKVTHSWGFRYNKHRCGIWDYCGQKFSYYGPYLVMVELFGEEHVV